jgi:hypothetical protein
MRQLVRSAAAAVMIFSALSGCGVQGTINNAVKQLEKGVTTFEGIKVILDDLAKNLDKGVYRDQVEEITRTTGQVAQLGVQGSQISHGSA